LFADLSLTPENVEAGARRPLVTGRMKVALALVLGVGIGLRLLIFCNRHSFGIDEARLALSIAARSYANLLPPLEHDQSAPLLFLWVERLLRDLLGVHDLVFRILPFAAGVGTVVLAYPVYRRLLERRAALIATSLTALAPTLVHYSSTAKQYTVETFVTLVLLRLALDWQDKPTQRGSVLLLTAGTISVWASGPAMFVLAAIAVSLALTLGPGGSKPRRWLLGAIVLWGVSLALAHLLVYRHAATNPYMERFWAPAFVTLSDMESLRRFSEALELFAWGLVMGELPPLPGGLGEAAVATIAALLLGLSVIGGVRIARLQGKRRATLVAGPLAAAFLASALRAYPVGVRVMVFSAPLLHVLVAGGVSGAVAALGPRHRQRVGWLAFGLVLLTYPFVGSLLRVMRYVPAREFRSLVTELRVRRQPGEALYVFAGSIPAWTFYTTDWRAPDTARLARLNALSRPGGGAFENAPSRDHEVRDEGEGMRYETATGPELLGVPTGMEFLAVVGLTRRHPDPRWAAHEAARIKSAGSQSAWVLMSEFYGPELELFRELEGQGATCTDVLAGSGTRLVRFEFNGIPQRPVTRPAGEEESLSEGCRLLR
jgi:hypothetical protein